MLKLNAELAKFVTECKLGHHQYVAMNARQVTKLRHKYQGISLQNHESLVLSGVRPDSRSQKGR